MYSPEGVPQKTLVFEGLPAFIGLESCLRIMPTSQEIVERDVENNNRQLEKSFLEIELSLLELRKKRVVEECKCIDGAGI